jgi:PAS domain-containing protein
MLLCRLVVLRQRSPGTLAALARQFFGERNHPTTLLPLREWRRKVLRTTTTGGTYSHQYRIIRNDRPIWVRAKGQCILDKAGRPERFPGVVIDITATRRAA